MSTTAYPEVPLGEVLTQARNDIQVEPGESYAPAGIYSFGKGLFARPPIDGADTKYKTFSRLAEGQFVYSKVGSWEGAVAVVPATLADFVVSPEYPVFDVNEARLEQRYLEWLCRWPGFRERLAPRGSMVRRKRVHPTQLLKVSIPLPPLDEQNRLVSRLEAVAGRAEAVRALSRRAAEIREAFTASTFSELVASAPSAQLGEVLTLDRDEVAVETEETYRPAGIKSFGKGLFARPPITGADTKYKKFNRLREGRFVYSRLKAWEGAVAVVGRELDGFVVSQEYPTFDINGKRLDAGYLAWICDWAGFWQMLADATRGLGARRERVPVARLLSTRIPLPPLTEQRRLGAIGAALGEAGRKATEVDRLLDALVPSAIGAALIGEL